MKIDDIVFNFIGEINSQRIEQTFGQNKKYVLLDPALFELDFIQLITYDEMYDAIYFSSEVVTPNMEYIGSVRLKDKFDKIEYVFFSEHIIVEYIKYIELFTLTANKATFLEFWLEQAPSYMIKVDVADFIMQEK